MNRILTLGVAVLICLAAYACGEQSSEDETARTVSDDDVSPPLIDDDTVGDDDDDDDASPADDDDESPAVELNWVPIPAGTFEMGCSPGDDECNPEELPAHTVNLDAFELSDTEITQEQYEAVMGGNPAFFQPPNIADPCPDCPVEQVLLEQAQHFCEAVGGTLPTEAQFEYAARAGTTTRYYCGDDPADLATIAWFAENAAGRTQAVAQLAPNDFELYDMLGNVHEFTQDWYDEDYYDQSPEDNPTGPSSGTYRVIRGGSWNNGAVQLRASFRGVNLPDNGNTVIGFRCARAAQ